MRFTSDGNCQLGDVKRYIMRVFLILILCKVIRIGKRVQPVTSKAQQR